MRAHRLPSDGAAAHCVSSRRPGKARPHADHGRQSGRAAGKGPRQTMTKRHRADPPCSATVQSNSSRTDMRPTTATLYGCLSAVNGRVHAESARRPSRLARGAPAQVCAQLPVRASRPAGRSLLLPRRHLATRRPVLAIFLVETGRAAIRLDTRAPRDGESAHGRKPRETARPR